MSDVTRILNAIDQGETKATEELLPLVYEELRILAAQKLSHEPPGQTLQATALVHEAYIRLVGEPGPAQAGQPQHWSSRGHFFAAAAEAMRRILVENARRKKSLKRVGGDPVMDPTGLETPFETTAEDLLALDEALSRLAGSEPEVADLVKLRYFVGMSIEQIADVRGISDRTVYNHLTYARAWLHRAVLRGSCSR